MRIERQGHQLGAAQSLLLQAGVAAVLLDQGLGLGGRAVGHGNARRPSEQQRPEHTGCGAAGAQQQDVQPLELAAGVDLDVAHQTQAVGVVGQNLSVHEAQGVGRLGQLHPGADLVGARKGLLLEGHGDVAALDALGLQALEGGGEAVQRHQQALVLQGLSRQFGETCVDLR